MYKVKNKTKIYVQTIFKKYTHKIKKYKQIK